MNFSSRVRNNKHLEEILGFKINVSLKERTKKKVDHNFSGILHKRMFPHFKYTMLEEGLRKLNLNFKDI